MENNEKPLFFFIVCIICLLPLPTINGSSDVNITELIPQYVLRGLPRQQRGKESILTSNLPFFLKKTDHAIKFGMNFTSFSLNLLSGCDSFEPTVQNNCSAAFERIFLKHLHEHCSCTASIFQNHFNFDKTLQHSAFHIYNNDTGHKLPKFEELVHQPRIKRNTDSLSITFPLVTILSRFRPKRQILLGFVVVTVVVGVVSFLHKGADTHAISSINKRLEVINRIALNNVELHESMAHIEQTMLDEMKILHDHIHVFRRTQIEEDYLSVFKGKAFAFTQLMENRNKVSPFAIEELFGVQIPNNLAALSAIDSCTITKLPMNNLLVLSLTVALPLVDVKKQIYEITGLVIYQKQNNSYCPYTYDGPRHLIFDEENNCSTIIPPSVLAPSEQAKSIFMFNFACNHLDTINTWERVGKCDNKSKMLVQPFYTENYVQIYCFGHKISINNLSAFDCPNSILKISVDFSFKIPEHSFRHLANAHHSQSPFIEHVYDWFNETYINTLTKQIGRDIKNLSDIIADERNQTTQLISIKDVSMIEKTKNWFKNQTSDDILFYFFVFCLGLAAILLLLCTCCCIFALAKVCKICGLTPRDLTRLFRKKEQRTPTVRFSTSSQTEQESVLFVP